MSLRTSIIVAKALLILLLALPTHQAKASSADQFVGTGGHGEVLATGANEPTVVHEGDVRRADPTVIASSQNSDADKVRINNEIRHLMKYTHKMLGGAPIGTPLMRWSRTPTLAFVGNPSPAQKTVIEKILYALSSSFPGTLRVSKGPADISIIVEDGAVTDKLERRISNMQSMKENNNLTKMKFLIALHQIQCTTVTNLSDSHTISKALILIEKKVDAKKFLNCAILKIYAALGLRQTAGFGEKLRFLSSTKYDGKQISYAGKLWRESYPRFALRKMYRNLGRELSIREFQESIRNEILATQ
jgi:hypothetical protein